MHKSFFALAISSTFVLPSSFAASFNRIISDFDRLITVDQSSKNAVDSNNHIASYANNTQKAAMVKCTEIQKSNYSQSNGHVFLDDKYPTESYVNCIGIPSSELFYIILNTDYTKNEDMEGLSQDVNPVSTVEKKAPHNQKAVNSTQKNPPKNKKINPFVSSSNAATTDPVTVQKLSQQTYINKHLPYYNRHLIVMMNCYAQFFSSKYSSKLLAYLKCKRGF